MIVIMIMIMIVIMMMIMMMIMIGMMIMMMIMIGMMIMILIRMMKLNIQIIMVVIVKAKTIITIIRIKTVIRIVRIKRITIIMMMMMMMMKIMDTGSRIDEHVNSNSRKLQINLQRLSQWGKGQQNKKEEIDAAFAVDPKMNPCWSKNCFASWLHCHEFLSLVILCCKTCDNSLKTFWGTLPKNIAKSLVPLPHIWAPRWGTSSFRKPSS